MKTAISMPDIVFHQVTERAGALGMSRSEFLATAAVYYLHHLDHASLTERINAVLDPDDDSNAAAAAAGRAALAADADGW